MGMAYWLGNSDSAHTVDRVLQETLGADGSKSPFQDLCSSIVPKCLADSVHSSGLVMLSSSKRKLNPLVVMTPSSSLPTAPYSQWNHMVIKIKTTTNEFVEYSIDYFILHAYNFCFCFDLFLGGGDFLFEFRKKEEYNMKGHFDYSLLSRGHVGKGL